MPAELMSGSARRLAEELDEDGIKLEEDDSVRELLLDELDYARRIPMFEGRRPLYGSFCMPPGMSISTAGGIADLVELDGLPQEMARTFADGRSAFIVNRHEDSPVLVCFDRPVQYEAELVHLQEVTGARIIQRTAVFGQVRLFADRRVISWDGQQLDRPPDGRRAHEGAAPGRARSRPGRRPRDARPRRALAVAGARRRHDRGPRGGLRVGVDGRGDEVPRAEAVKITNRQHFPALFASLQQHDLATLVTGDGDVMYLGVGLRSSAARPRRRWTATAACATARRSASATTTPRRRSP